MAQEWIKNKRNGMTQRLACRLFLCAESPPQGIKDSSVLEIAFGVGIGSRKQQTLPVWWKNMVTYFIDYDPNWFNWNEDEKNFVTMRLVQGLDSKTIKACLQIPDAIFQECVKNSMIALSNKSESIQKEEIPSPQKETSINDMFQAKFEEYGKKVDLSNPVNKATIAHMIVLETKLDSLTTKLMETEDVVDLEKLSRSYAVLREQYSKSAEDVAQLQKQQEIRADGETMDDVFEAVLSELPSWRNTFTDIFLEESGLIKHMVSLHKVDLFGMMGTPDKVSGVEARTGDINAVAKSSPIIIPNDEKEGGDTFAIATGD